MASCKHPALPPGSEHFANQITGGECQCYCLFEEEGVREIDSAVGKRHRTIAALAIFEWNIWIEGCRGESGDHSLIGYLAQTQWRDWESGEN